MSECEELKRLREELGHARAEARNYSKAHRGAMRRLAGALQAEKLEARVKELEGLLNRPCVVDWANDAKWHAGEGKGCGAPLSLLRWLRRRAGLDVPEPPACQCGAPLQHAGDMLCRACASAALGRAAEAAREFNQRVDDAYAKRTAEEHEPPTPAPPRVFRCETCLGLVYGPDLAPGDDCPNGLCSGRLVPGRFVPDAPAAAPAREQGDWTESGGRSNSSALYRGLVDAIARLIRGDAHMLICGRADDTAGLIASQLAYEWGFVPTPASYAALVPMKEDNADV